MTSPAALPTAEPISYHVSLPQTGKPDKVIILLHGMSHSAAAMMRVARPLIREHEPQAAIFALNAPFHADPDHHPLAVKPRGPGKSRVWYELPKGNFSPRREIAEKLRTSVERTEQMINEACGQTGLSDRNVHIIAFSQGCAPAFQVALNRPNLAAVALLCGNVWDPRILNTPAKGNKTPKSARAGEFRTAPIFYAYIDGDDTVPRPLHEHSKLVMRGLRLPVALHITPQSKVQSFTDIHGTHYVREMMRPTWLNYIVRPVEGVAPIGSHDLERLTSIVRFADDGFGNLKYTGIDLKLRASPHFVNPAILRAMHLWFYHKQVNPEFGLAKIDDVHIFKRASLEWLERGWAVSPTRLDASRPEPLPQWHSPHHTFNRLHGRIRHTIAHSFAQIVRRLTKPLHPYFYLLPEPAERMLINTFKSADRRKGPRHQHTPEAQARIRKGMEHLKKL